MSPSGLTIGTDATFMGYTHSCSDQEKVLCFVIYSKVRTKAKSGKTHEGPIMIAIANQNSVGRGLARFSDS